MERIFTKSDLLRIRVTIDDGDTYQFSVQERYWRFFWQEIHYEEVHIKDFWNPFGPMFDKPLKTTVISYRHGSFDHETWKPGTFKLEDKIKEIFDRLDFSQAKEQEIKKEIEQALS